MISLSSNANQRVVTSKLGVPYDGDISMFSEQLAPIPANTNYFDLFLGEMNLLETMVQAVTNIRNIEILLVMASVDFYNHDTERSKLAQGCKCDLQS